MKKLLGAVAALALVVLAGCSSAGNAAPAKASGLNDQSGGGPYSGVGLVPPQPRPSFTLTGTSGATYAFGQRTSDKATLLYFGYTRCPDVCPETMADIGVALRQLPAAISSQVTVVFASTDVKHDTGPIIDTWLKNFSPNTHATFVGLRGTQSQIDAAEASSHVLLSSDAGRTHASEVLLFSPDNYAHDSFIFNDSNESKQIEHDLSYVLSHKG